MRRWIREQLDLADGTGGPLRIVLDPDQLLSEADLEDLAGRSAVELARDWLELRRVYEFSGRHRIAESPAPLTIVVTSGDFQEARLLPWDIGRAATVTRIRLQAHESVRKVVRELPEDLQDIAIEGSTGPDPVGDLIQAVWGIAIPRGGSSEVVELGGVIRLRTDPTVPAPLWPLVRERLRTPLALGLASDPPDTDELQAAWADWVLNGNESGAHTLFDRLGARVATLFFAGLLIPVRADRVTPRWAAAGTRPLGNREKAEALLDAPAVVGTPTSVGDWLQVAEWWGEVRLALARGAPETDDLAEVAWSRWNTLDEDFRVFLHTEFGRLLTSAAGRPQTVQRIAPFLARRLRDGSAGRVMLVVFDGMGFPQWSMMRQMASLRVIEASGVLAMAPTLTPISRQAIFAGALPNTFPDDFAENQNEGNHWRSLWVGEGIPVTDVGYMNIEGIGPAQVPSFPDKRAVGVVVRAIDELMHTSELLVDAQFAGNVETWLKQGFVSGLVQRATEEGFEIWFTADHGSLPVIPLGRPMEGLAVDTAGTRVRLYSTKALRDQSRAEGDAWDPPGMPASGPFSLFPWGRFGFRHNARVTHGGLSLDEMMVPLVRVAP